MDPIPKVRPADIGGAAASELLRQFLIRRSIWWRRRRRDRESGIPGGIVVEGRIEKKVFCSLSGAVWEFHILCMGKPEMTKEERKGDFSLAEKLNHNKDKVPDQRGFETSAESRTRREMHSSSPMSPLDPHAEGDIPSLLFKSPPILSRYPFPPHSLFLAHIQVQPCQFKGKGE